MGCQVAGVTAGDIHGIYIGVSEADLKPVGIQSLSVRAPGHRIPIVIWRRLVRQFTDLVSCPVQQCEVVTGRFLGLVIQRDGLSIPRPARRLFAYVGSVCQIDDLTSIAWHGKNVPQFITTSILLEDDPLAVR